MHCWMNAAMPLSMFNENDSRAIVTREHFIKHLERFIIVLLSQVVDA